MKEEILKRITKTNKNMLITGTLAIGKTQNIGFPLVEEKIKAQESLFILDAKNEYLRQYYDVLKANNYQIIIINTRDLHKSEGWNVLEYPYQLYQAGLIDKSLNYLELIGEDLFYEDKSADPFWSQSASDLFTGVTLGLFNDAKPSEININSVNSMINSITEKCGNSNYLTEYFKTKDKSDLAYVYAANTILAPMETRGGIVSVAKQKLRLLVSRENVCQQLLKTTFNYEDLINKPTAIFFITKDESPAQNILSSLFITQFYSFLVDHTINYKFNFILDNLDANRPINNLVSMMSGAIARNIQFTLFTRSKAYLEELYGSYINNLCDEINVKEKTIEFRIGEAIDSIAKNNIESTITTPNIEYPHILSQEIHVFDLKKYISSQQSTSDKSPKYSIDEVIKTIDAKLEELDREEQDMLANKQSDLK